VEDLRLAEISREGDMLGIGDVLVRKHEHEMASPGVPNGLDRIGVQRLSHIDAADLRAERGMARLDGDCHDFPMLDLPGHRTKGGNNGFHG
jgi:hypothetical protein